MNPKVDLYMAEGCGRCPLFRTPNCRVHLWHEELETLRSILLDSGLTEELKWSHPVYTFQDNNLVLLGAFKEKCTISFFKGALLNDPKGILTRPTENTQAGRLINFTNISQVNELESDIKDFIKQSIEVEKAGQKVSYVKASEMNLPEELLTKFDEDPSFKNAFERLTPGRQKGYILHFSAAKQSQTRISRIEKATEQIFMGKGMND
jgi:uncharacterized protein YdeI (YjbR/CyaY-like superfamily)